ncbi:MAG: hypothetical protein ACJA0S_000885 [Rickettsiales bacterium]|jgi:hypothetical protein
MGMDYGEWDEIITEMYWRCRYNLVMDRRIHDEISADSIKNNAVIDKIGEEMLRNLSRAKYSALSKIDDDIDLTDHKECFSQGFSINIGQNNDDYYSCRTNLVLRRIPPAPKITHSFEASALPPDRIDDYLRTVAKNSKENNRESSMIVEQIQRYPKCIGLAVGSKDFYKCSSASDRSAQCLSLVHLSISKKVLEDKTYCQEQAFIQFPDDYALAKNKSASEIEKLKAQIKSQKDIKSKDDGNVTLAYLKGERTISSVGGVEGDGDEEKFAKEEIYTKVELMKLREYFVFQCNAKMDDKIPEFVEEKKKVCFDIAENWD